MPKTARLSMLVVLPVIALTLAATALVSASQPKKGATYAGKINQPGPGNYKLPLRFEVSKSGKTVGGFRMSDGPPTATTCASGPWGHPVSHSASVSGKGRFSITMRLADGKDNPDVGRIKIAGEFRSHGRFSGTAYTRTDSSSCNADFPFSIDAQ